MCGENNWNWAKAGCLGRKDTVSLTRREVDRLDVYSGRTLKNPKLWEFEVKPTILRC